MKSNFQYLKRLFKPRKSVAILDDFFPNLLTAFRVAEYNWYLERFPSLIIYSTNPDFDVVYAGYAQSYPQYADRVKQYDKSSLDDCAFVYMNFLNNAAYFLPALTEKKIPFLVTLYPGGGFGLNEAESDLKLDRILRSPLLRGVIATQSITLEYLRTRGCPVPVHDIYGGAMHPLYLDNKNASRPHYLGANTLHICFVAERYMPQGANKGYPQFIDAAQTLIHEFPALRFSVVGSFDQYDVPLSNELQPAITFHGLLPTARLRDFFFTQDIIISPNRPFLLHPGNFDGFPTGCCVEASLCGVAVICSDELKLNRYYTDGEDMIICEPTREAIVSAVEYLVRNTDQLKRIGEAGRMVSRRLFDPVRQLGQRALLLEKYAAAQAVDI